MTSLKRSRRSDPLAEQISNKIVVRSLRNGKVQKITREVYLRTDIPCSSKFCSACLAAAPRGADSKPLQPILNDTLTPHANFPAGLYLVPDADVLMDGIDLFEYHPQFSDVIVLQTVLEELRNRSLPVYNRLVALTTTRRFYVFFNEFRLETHLPRRPGESAKDHNGHAIRRAVAWYGEHLKQAAGGRAPAVVLLAADPNSLAKARIEGLHAQSLGEYFPAKDGGDGRGVAPNIEGTNKFRGSKMLYDEYYPSSRLLSGIRSGLIHNGIFKVSPYNYLEGTVDVPAFQRSLLVVGRESINRAVDGDEVSVEVLPRAQWKEASARIIEETTLTRNENADADVDGDEARALTSEEERRALQEAVRKAHSAGEEEGRAQPTAKIVGIRKRSWRRNFVGHIDPSSVAARAKSATSSGGGRPEAVFVILVDRRMPKIQLRTRQAGHLLGQRLLVAIDNWPRDSRHPVGHLVRPLGVFEAKAVETEALLLEHGVEYRRFSQQVLDCLPPEGHDWRVPESKDDPVWRRREDLRHLDVCSIDPIGCQDIDDALHARPLDNGNFEVGVHIADVTHFVREDTKMDEQASIRGTTVYLVDKRIDMLPPLLGTDLCSLRPRVDRLAFSVVWELTANADVVAVRFTKSVIRSREAFSYEDAQARIDDGSQRDDLTTGMRTLMTLSKKLKQKRVDAGALSLSSPEIRVEFESETSDPIDVKAKQLLDTNSLVEEFMLLANISVAKRNQHFMPGFALLRRHPAPPSSKFGELAAQLKARRGLELNTETSRELADSLDRCVDPVEPFFNTLIRILATRCMMSAEYLIYSAAEATEQQKQQHKQQNQGSGGGDCRHYGLATPIYTHFTSPIRRYADVIVHRQLAAAIGFEPFRPDAGRLRFVCTNINVRHRNAQLAGRASVAYYVGQALRGRAAEEDGFVMRVFNNGFVVYVPRFGLEGLIRLRDLGEPEPDAVFDPDKYELTIGGGKGGNLCVALFDKVRVRVSDKEEKESGRRGVKMEFVR